jgi:hypothetical protein
VSQDAAATKHGWPLEDDTVTQSVRVEVTLDEHRHMSSFTCPSCGRRVRLTNKHPFGWPSKVCPSCRTRWVNLAAVSVGPHIDQLEAGAKRSLWLGNAGIR